MLTIITGRAKTGKSTYCRAAFAEKALSSQEPSYYIVPEQYTVEAEKKILSLDIMAGRALFMSEVLSFKRLAHRILGKLGGGAGNILNSQARSMLLASVLSDMCSRGELGYYTDISRRPGEIISLLKLFDELELYNSDNSLLWRKLSAIPDSVTGTQKVKYSDIFSIYRRFSERVNDSYLSGAKAWETAAELSERYGFFAGKSVWIDEFGGFTDAELRIILCMLKEGADVTVTLCTSNSGEPVFYAIDRTLLKLRSVSVDASSGFEVKDISEIVPVLENNGVNSLLKRIEHAYTKLRPQKIDVNTLDRALIGTVTLNEAPDTYAESVAAAERITELLGRGYRYSEIAVAVRNISDYGVFISTVFGGKGIPFFIDDVKSINSNAAIVTLTALLDVYLSGMKPEYVTILLKSGFFVTDRDRQDELENYIISHNMRYPSKYAASDVPECKMFYEIYTSLKQIFGEAENLSQAADGFVAFLQERGIDTRALEMSELLERDGENEKADEFRRVWNIIIGIIELIKNFLGEERAENAAGIASQLKKYMLIGFSELKIGFIPQEQNAVRVVGMGRSRIGNPRVTLVLGVNEGVMPAEVNDTGILRDYERDEFEAAGISLADSSLSRAYKELFMIYSALFSPTDELHISYAAADAKGEELLPSSRVVKRLTAVAPFISKSENPAIDRGGHSSDNAPADGSDTRTDANTIEPGPGSEGYEFSVSPALSGRLTGKGNRSVISISQVEAYNNCPMSYFLERGIGLSERDNGEFRITDIGTIMHAILEKGGMEFSHADTLNMSDSELSEFAKSLTDKYFSELTDEFYPEFDLIYSPKNRLMMNKIKEASSVILNSLGQQYRKSRFKTLAFECEFSEKGMLPALTVRSVEDPEKTVLVNGKIDRLDAFFDGKDLYISVVDYKSSKKQIKEYDVAEGLRIQLITYIKAASENAQSRDKLLSLAGATWNLDCASAAGESNDAAQRTGVSAKESTFVNDEPAVTPGAGLYFVFGSGIKVISDRSKMPKSAGESANEQFKMSGLIIGGSEIADYLGGSGAGGVVAIPRSGPISPEKFRSYSETVDKVILSTASGIGSGTFGPRPKRSSDGKIHCEYCPYYPVCGIEISGKKS